MAEIGKLFVTIGSKFDPKGIKEMTSRLDKLKARTEKMAKGFKIAGAVMTGFAVAGVALIKKLTNAYAIQEKAERLLGEALAQTKNITGVTLDELKKYASEMQRVTTVGDETSLAVMQLGLNMGVSADQIADATKQSIGLSKAYKIDLKTSMKMVALARQGEFTMLARYIPQLRGVKDKTELLRITNEALAKGFKIATAETETYAGRMVMLGNRFGDVQERIGEALMPAMHRLMDVGDKMLTWFENLSPSMKNMIGKTILWTTAIAGLLAPILLLIGFLPAIAGGFMMVMGALAPVLPILIAISAAIALLTVAWVKDWGGIQDKTRITITAIAEYFKFLWSVISNYFTLIAGTFVMLAKIIAQPFKAKEHFTEWVNNTKEAVENVKTAFTDGVERIKAKSLELKNAKIKDVKDTAKETIGTEKQKNVRLLAEQVAASNKRRRADIVARQAEIESIKKDREEMAALAVAQYNAEIKAFQEKHAKEIEMLTEFRTTFTDAFQTMFVSMLTETKSGSERLKEFFGSIADAFIASVARMIAKWAVFQLITGIFGKVLGGGFLKFFQTGVKNFAGGLAVVGEAGPELVNLPRGSDVHTAGETKKMLSGGGITLNVMVTGNTISDEVGADGLADTISEKILRDVKNERNI